MMFEGILIYVFAPIIMILAILNGFFIKDTIYTLMAVFGFVAYLFTLFVIADN